MMESYADAGGVDEVVLPVEIDLAVELTIAWLSNPTTRADADDVPAFLASMHKAISDLTSQPTPADTPIQTHVPAVSVRKSVADPDWIVSMIDGKKYRTLKRHLSGNGLTPDEYRARYGLKADYPIVAASYSAARSQLAKKLGLGNKGRKATGKQAVEAPKTGATASKLKTGRISAADAKKRAKAHLGG